MPMHLQKCKITYVSVPKCACSSLKLFFYELEFGAGFKRQVSKPHGVVKTIHGLYPSTPFDTFANTKGIWRHKKIAVIRDPVSRLLSCYQDKVLSGNYLRQDGVAERGAERGLPEKPDLQTFVGRLAEYQSISNVIKRHSRPLSFFLGKKPSWYHAIFDISEIEALRKYVDKRVKSDLQIRHANRTKAKISKQLITAEIQSEIRRQFAEDIALYGKWMRFSE